jgi:hypothetical protein
MKKILYTLLFVVFTSTAMISCTEEEVKPTTTKNAGGGAGSSDTLK